MYSIGMDLDGVMHEFDASFRKYVIDAGIVPEHCCTPVIEMDFYLEWGISHQEFKEICHAGVDAGVIFMHGDPFPGTREAVDTLYNAGHQLHIITDRSFGTDNYSEDLTKEWLRQHSIKYHTITFSPDKTVVPTDFFIEDKPENYDALDATDCTPYLLNRPWNQANDDRRRVDTLEEFVEAVKDQRVLDFANEVVGI